MTENQERGLRRRLFLWQFVLKYGAALIVLVFYVTVMMHFSSTPDDTYVYLQYGRHIARGDGFSFQGGSPSYGITSPLWALLIAGGSKITLDPYIVAKTLDVVFASLALLTTLAFAYIVIRDRVYALIAAFTVSFDAWMLMWAGSGTETSLALLLTMVAFWFAYKKEYLQASLAAAILTLVRPEGVILFLASMTDAALNSRNKKGVVKVIAASLVLFSIVVGSWAVVAFVQFGTIVPNAWRTWTFGPISASATFTKAIGVVKTIGVTQCLSVLLMCAGVLVTLRRSGWRVIREEGFPLLWTSAVPLYFILFSEEVSSRQLVIVIPVVVVYGMWGIKRMEIEGLVSAKRGFLILLVAAAFSLGQNQLVYRGWIVPHLENLALGVNECYKPIAYWLRSHTPPGTKILTPDPGVLAYVSEREIYDTAGLIRGEPVTLFPEYLVDRNTVPERLASRTCEPIMTRTFSATEPFSGHMVYYTLYKVHP